MKRNPFPQFHGVRVPSPNIPEGKSHLQEFWGFLDLLRAQVLDLAWEPQNWSFGAVFAPKHHGNSKPGSRGHAGVVFPRPVMVSSDSSFHVAYRPKAARFH